MFERFRFLRRRKALPAPARADLMLDQAALEQVLARECSKDSFDELEDLERILSPGVGWRRRRLGWTDAITGEDQGLCINELRIARNAGANLRPSIAMTQPGLTDFDTIEYAYWQTVWATGAMRLAKGERRSRLFVNMRSLTCSRSGAPRGPWEDLIEVQRRLQSGEWRDEYTELLPMLSPTLRRKDDDEETAIARYLPAFPPSWAVLAQERVLAATNGGYFLNFPEEYEDGLSALHQPIGALFAEGQLHMPPWIRRPCALEWKDGRRGIELLGPDNLALRTNDGPTFLLATGVLRPDAPATVWRSFDGEIPEPETAEAVDLVFSGTGLAHVAKPGTHTPPIGGAIVRLEGDYAQPWRAWLTSPKGTPFPSWDLTLMPSRDEPLEWVLAAGPRLLYDCLELDAQDILQPWAAGEFAPGGPAPTRFPYDADQSRGPRTAIGLTRHEEWVLIVVDGRTEPSHSVGLTLAELARLMRHLGCVQAMNLDGGGSSVMAVEGVSQLDQLKPGLAVGVANIPSDPGSRERIVPVLLTVTTE